MSKYCSPLPYECVNNLYLPMCSNNAFDLGFNSHIRMPNQPPYLTVSHVFPGVAQLGDEAGANGPIFIQNNSHSPIIELKRRYDQKGAYRVYSGNF
jgi:hypothetical protein